VGGGEKSDHEEIISRNSNGHFRAGFRLIRKGKRRGSPRRKGGENLRDRVHLISKSRKEESNGGGKQPCSGERKENEGDDSKGKRSSSPGYTLLFTEKKKDARNARLSQSQVVSLRRRGKKKEGRKYQLTGGRENLHRHSGSLRFERDSLTREKKGGKGGGGGSSLKGDAQVGNAITPGKKGEGGE